jgi:ubiquinone/menaquinone biosynthesis C-methylase UbiE
MAADSTNRWFDEGCARAFWDQRQALPYQDLLRDTAAWLDPRPGQTWLDLGCGGGQLTALLWTLSAGQLGRIVAMDCAAVNAQPLARLQERLTPRPGPGQIVFRAADFSHGLPDLASNSFDGVVSGLAISYAESRDPVTGRYTDTAYNRLLAELFRVLKPEGRLVFSVNVPEPRFWRIFWRSLRRGLRISHAGRLLLNLWRMQRHGRWLKREARRGRFHFLPVSEVLGRLARVGFEAAEHRLSYAEQAYVFRVRKAAVAADLAA